MILSVLMASTFDRLRKFTTMLAQVEAQMGRDDAEFLMLVDDRKQSLGAKCNALVKAAKGDYCVIVDDDDEVDPEFVNRIVAAAKGGDSCVVYPILFFVNGALRAHVHTSIECVPRDDWDNGMLYRSPDKKMAIRRQILLDHPFPDRWAGSDWRQAKKMRHALTTEVLIPSPLYKHMVRTTNNDCRAEALARGEFHAAERLEEAKG